MKVLGFVGPKGAGKDEAYKILHESGKVKRKMSFAAPLKEICKKVFELSDYQVDDPAGKEREFATPIVLTIKHLRAINKELTAWVDAVDPVTGIIRYNVNRISVSGLEGVVFKTPRYLLQFIGTDYIRDRVWKDWHVTAALSDKALATLPDPNAIYAVTDVRFENELNALKERFGAAFACFYIERPEAEERLKMATHPSELVSIKLREALGPDAVLKNDGDVEDFKKVLKNIKVPSEPYKLPKKQRFVFGERE
jgi:hypothetical protein